jgi:hypothetical protein
MHQHYLSGKDAPRKQNLVRLAEIAIFLFMRVRLDTRARSGIPYIWPVSGQCLYRNRKPRLGLYFLVAEQSRCAWRLP